MTIPPLYRSWDGRQVEPIVAPAGNLYWVRTDLDYSGISESTSRVLSRIGTRNEIAFEVEP